MARSKKTRTAVRARDGLSRRSEILPSAAYLPALVTIADRTPGPQCVRRDCNEITVPPHRSGYVCLVPRALCLSIRYDKQRRRQQQCQPTRDKYLPFVGGERQEGKRILVADMQVKPPTLSRF